MPYFYSLQQVRLLNNILNQAFAACVKLFSIFTLLNCPLCMNNLIRADRTEFEANISNLKHTFVGVLIITQCDYHTHLYILDFGFVFHRVLVLSILSSHGAKYNLIFKTKVLSDGIKGKAPDRQSNFIFRLCRVSVNILPK